VPISGVFGKNEGALDVLKFFSGGIFEIFLKKLNIFLKNKKSFKKLISKLFQNIFFIFVFS